MYVRAKPLIVLLHFQYGKATSLLKPFIYIDFVRLEPHCSRKDDKGLFLDIAYTWGVQVVRYPNFFLGNGSR